MSFIRSARPKRRIQILGGVVAASVAVSLMGVGAQAAPGKRKNGKAKSAVTMVKFKLANEDVTAGDSLAGNIKVSSGGGRNRAPLAGAELAVTIDGVDAGSITTAEDGTATITVIAEEGDHVVKVVYAGDADHKRAKRAQGYEAVAAPEPITEPVPDEGLVPTE